MVAGESVGGVASILVQSCVCKLLGEVIELELSHSSVVKHSLQGLADKVICVGVFLRESEYHIRIVSYRVAADLSSFNASVVLDFTGLDLYSLGLLSSRNRYLEQISTLAVDRKLIFVNGLGFRFTVTLGQCDFKTVHVVEVRKIEHKRNLARRGNVHCYEPVAKVALCFCARICGECRKRHSRYNEQKSEGGC